MWGLNEDRADIILPACTLYSQVMKAAGVNKITISGLGLKDGIIADLLERHHSVPVADFHANERFLKQDNVALSPEKVIEIIQNIYEISLITPNNQIIRKTLVITEEQKLIQQLFKF